jgi:hypothetical protein
VTVIGEAFIEVRPDSAGFGPQAEKSVLGSVTSIAKKAAKIIGTVFVAQQGAQFFKGAITGASDLSESISKNEVVFGAASDKVQEFGENAARAFGQSRAQALEATGVFGNLLRAVGLSEDKSADFSTTLTGLASDLASFNNTEVDEALNALRAGLVGETEPLKRFGVNLNDATLKAKALELGLSDGKETLDASAKAQAAYALILEQTELAQGDFARTSGGLANQQRILAAQWTDMQAKVGNLLLPAITKLATVANNVLLPGVENLARSLANTLGPAFTGVADVVRELAGPGGFAASLAVEIGKLLGLTEDSDAVDGMATAFERVQAAIIGARDTAAAAIDIFRNALAAGDNFGFTAATDGIQGAAAEAGAAVAEYLVAPMQGVTEAWQLYAREGVGPVADAISNVRDTAEEVNRVLAEQRDILIPAAAAAASFAAAFVTYTQVSRAISGVQAAFSLLGPAIGSALAPLLANPVGLIIAGIVALGAAVFVAYKEIEPFRNAVDAIARTVRDVAVEAFDRAREAVGQLADAFSGVADTVGDVLAEVTDVAGDVADDVIGALQPIVDWLDENLFSTLEAAGEFFAALFDRVEQVLSPFVRLWVAQMELVVGIVKDGLVAALRIAGPIVTAVLRNIGDALQLVARVAVPIFATAIDALKLVVETTFNTISGIIEGALSAIRGIFQIGTGVLRGDFSKIWEGLDNLVLGPLRAVRDIVTENFGAVVEFIGTLPGRVAELITALWRSVIDITGTQVRNFQDIVGGAVDGIVGFFSGLPGRLLGFVESIGGAAFDIGKAIIGKLFEGLGGLADRAAELGAGLLAAVRDLGKSIINGVIDALNNILPNRIGRVEIDTPVGSQTIFPGIDLPDNPIPRLASGALIRRRPGGVFANLAEGATDEAVIPLPTGLLDGLRGIAAGGGRGGGVVIEAGAIQIVAPDTPAAAIAQETMALIGWELTTRSDR